MSSKRARIREMKRKKRQRRQMTITGIVIVSVLVAVWIAYAVVNRYNEGYVMVFEGKKISASDMRFCAFWASSGNETASEAQIRKGAFDYLLEALVLEKKANENNITLSQEEIDYNNEMGEGWVNYLGLDYITPKRVAELQMAMGPKYEKLLELFTEGFAVDEAAFEEGLADFIENDKLEYYTIDLKYIISYDEEPIAQAFEELEAGGDFDAVWAKYSEDYHDHDAVDEDDADEHDHEINVFSLRELGIGAEFQNIIFETEAGNYTDPMDIDGIHVIFYVIANESPSESEIREIFRERFVTDGKEEMFNGIKEGWMRDADYKINQKGFDAVPLT